MKDKPKFFSLEARIGYIAVLAVAFITFNVHTLLTAIVAILFGYNVGWDWLLVTVSSFWLLIVISAVSPAPAAILHRVKQILRLRPSNAMMTAEIVLLGYQCIGLDDEEERLIWREGDADVFLTYYGVRVQALDTSSWAISLWQPQPMPTGLLLYELFTLIRNKNVN